jgi:hypothetical protein
VKTNSCNGGIVVCLFLLNVADLSDLYRNQLIDLAYGAIKTASVELNVERPLTALRS